MNRRFIELQEVCGIIANHLHLFFVSHMQRHHRWDIDRPIVQQRPLRRQ